MLLMLLISVFGGMALAVVVELAANRGECVQTWIEDAHPTFARPMPDVAPTRVRVARKPQLRSVGHCSAARVTGTRVVGTGRGADGRQRRRALRLY